MGVYHDTQTFKKSRKCTSKLAQQFQGDLKLAGLASRTIQAYMDGVCGLAEHYRLSPERISESQARQYILYLTEERHLAPNTIRPILAGLKFLYSHTLPRNWKSFHAIRIPKTQVLPVVMTPEQVWTLIDATETLHYETFFRVAYTCGLRPGDARHLEVGDVDSPRRLLHIRHTKGGNQRYVPLPETTLEALRQYWATHRHPKWLFPSRAAVQYIAQAPGPMSERGIQRAFQKVVEHLGFKRKGLCPHTLRHSYATAMLEAGVNLKVLQTYLGHKTLQATAIYLHLTRNSNDKARQIVDDVMNGPPTAEDHQQAEGEQAA